MSRARLTLITLCMASLLAGVVLGICCTQADYTFDRNECLVERNTDDSTFVQCRRVELSPAQLGGAK